MSNNEPQSDAASGLTLFLLLFVGLKLTGYIDWSWWWVMAPLWIIPAILLVAVTVFGLMFVICYLFCILIEKVK